MRVRDQLLNEMQNVEWQIDNNFFLKFIVNINILKFLKNKIKLILNQLLILMQDPRKDLSPHLFVVDEDK